jgi:hypothetical protein
MVNEERQAGVFHSLREGATVYAVFAPNDVSDISERARSFVGWSGRFEALWIIEVGQYAGEWAMKFPRGWQTGAIWAPASDLKPVDARTMV